MNSHDLANILLAAPAKDLQDMGSNENYAHRFSLKGLKVPGIASIGGWVYPAGDVESTEPEPVKPAAKPIVRAKRSTAQEKSAPVAVQKPGATKPVATTKAPEVKSAAAPQGVSTAQLAEILKGLGLTLTP